LSSKKARAYIERINIRGNTRTATIVICREFDLGEVMPITAPDRSRRAPPKNLNYFKTVKITNEPGSAPDRVVINVDVESRQPASSRFPAAIDRGRLYCEVVADRNLMGRGNYGRRRLFTAERTRGFDLSFVEPFLFGYRMAGGIDLFARQNLASNYVSYDSQTIGTICVSVLH
jgi:outer membrane protein insertion porin family